MPDNKVDKKDINYSEVGDDSSKFSQEIGKKLNDYLNQNHPDYAFRNSEIFSLFFIVMVSATSAVLYYDTNMVAADLFKNKLRDKAGFVIFKSLVVLGGVFTNWAFNCASYLDIYNSYHRGEFSGKKILWIFATIIGFFATLPVWYLGYIAAENLTQQIIVTVSAILNSPIYVVGSRRLIDSSVDASKKFVKRFYLSREQFENDKKTITEEQHLVVHLKNQVVKFSALSSTDRTTNYNEIIRSDASEKTEIFNNFLNANFDICPKEISFYAQSAATFFWLMISVAGMFQNWGWAVETYIAAAAYSNPYAGFIAAFINLLPNIGFTISGISFSKQLIQDSLEGLPTIESMAYPKLYKGLFGLIGFLALWSGFTGFQVGFENWFWGGDTAKTMSGIGHLIGVALLFNTMEALSVVNLIVQKIILKHRSTPLSTKNELKMIQCFSEIADSIAAQSPEQFSQFLGDSKYGNTCSGFLEQEDSDAKNNSVSGITMGTKNLVSAITSICRWGRRDEVSDELLDDQSKTKRCCC